MVLRRKTGVYVALAASLALVSWAHLSFYIAQVEGESMLPRLQDHSRVLVSLAFLHSADIHRGDVVVISGDSPGRLWVKRIIGTPGDRVKMIRGQVYLDDHAIVEPYVAPAFRSDDSYPESVVPPDSYFVLSDNRLIFTDSRRLGFISGHSIDGRVVVVANSRFPGRLSFVR